MLSWQQELPTNDLTEYVVEASYVGPCPSTGTSLSRELPLEAREYIFQDLHQFGTYDLTVTVLSSTNQMAVARITVQTLPTSKLVVYSTNYFQNDALHCITTGLLSSSLLVQVLQVPPSQYRLLTMRPST